MSSTSPVTGSHNVNKVNRKIVYHLDAFFPAYMMVVFAKALREVSDRVEKLEMISYTIVPRTFDVIAIEYRVGAITEDTEFFIKIGEAIRQVRINFEANGGFGEQTT